MLSTSFKTASNRATQYIGIPAFWLIWGFFGYPLVCSFTGLLSFWVAAQFGITSDGSFFNAASGGFLGVMAGLPLGVVTAYSAMCWQDAWFSAARGTAFWGGLVIGGGWLKYIAALPTVAWVDEFGFFTPPIVWSIGLILFAIIVRVDPRD